MYVSLLCYHFLYHFLYHLYVSLLCLTFMYHFYVITLCITLCIIFMSHFYVSLLCLTFMSHFYVSLLCITFMSSLFYHFFITFCYHFLYPKHRKVIWKINFSSHPTSIPQQLLSDNLITFYHFSVSLLCILCFYAYIPSYNGTSGHRSVIHMGTWLIYICSTVFCMRSWSTLYALKHTHSIILCNPGVVGGRG